MKGSFGPNFNNKMMVPSQNEKKNTKQTQPNSSQPPKGASVMTFRQSNQPSVGQLHPSG